MKLVFLHAFKLKHNTKSVDYNIFVCKKRKTEIEIKEKCMEKEENRKHDQRKVIINKIKIHRKE